MLTYKLQIVKANFLRQRFIDGTYNSYALAKELRCSTATTWHYQREFEKIRAQYPDRLKDFGFYPGEPPRPHQETSKHIQLTFIIPVIISQETKTLNTQAVWEKYCQYSTDFYTWRTFKGVYIKWLKESVTFTPTLLLDYINPKDMVILTKWRKGNDKRLWQIARVLMLANKGLTRLQILEKVESSYRSLDNWIAGYKAKGLEAFVIAPFIRNGNSIDLIKERKERITKLINETPKVHGLNRTSWNMAALCLVYNQLYTPKVNYWQICRCVNQMGYNYKKSKKMLTSPDPKFKEKIKKIQTILQKLKPNEKFFSIDEYGPVGIKIKGGRTLKLKTESPDYVPEKQKAKGYIICTAALELSTNQVSHFYSLKKNTFEMIKLIELLINQYHDQSKLYLSWDAVSWHNSKILKRYIDEHNEINKPKIILVPLPASTQWLNVIESVFGGLAKAVIHNSAYQSVDECKTAINLHFAKRNSDFKANPKRAGKKIWGKEITQSSFSETHMCRDVAAMKGTKLK